MTFWYYFRRLVLVSIIYFFIAGVIFFLYNSLPSLAAHYSFTYGDTSLYSLFFLGAAWRSLPIVLLLGYMALLALCFLPSINKNIFFFRLRGGINYSDWWIIGSLSVVLSVLVLSQEFVSPSKLVEVFLLRFKQIVSQPVSLLFKEKFVNRVNQTTFLYFEEAGDDKQKKYSNVKIYTVKNNQIRRILFAREGRDTEESIYLNDVILLGLGHNGAISKVENYQSFKLEKLDGIKERVEEFVGEGVNRKHGGSLFYGLMGLPIILFLLLNIWLRIFGPNKARFALILTAMCFLLQVSIVVMVQQ